MKPIEPGCLALHAGKFETRTVRCIRRASKLEVAEAMYGKTGRLGRIVGDSFWLVDPPVRWRNQRPDGTNRIFTQLPYSKESQLTRIDGHDPEAEPEVIEREEIV